MKPRDDGIYKKYGIYGIRNKLNSKLYIGKTMVNFGDRWDCHKGQLRGNYHDNKHLQNAWNKYGEDNFEFFIIHDCIDGENVDRVNQLEIEYIQKYRASGMNLYNISPGGDGGAFLGKHLSDETKRKIGEKNRVNMTGRKASNTTKAKMSASQKKRYDNWSEEDRLAWGQKVGVKNKGRKWTEEQRHKMKGNKNGATLTLDQVIEIRRLYEKEGRTFSEIAKMMGINRTTVYNIATYRRWKENA